MFKKRHSFEFLSKYTTIDAGSWYNQGKSATTVAGCSKKMNSYFVQCQPYITEGEYSIRKQFLQIYGKYLSVSATSADVNKSRHNSQIKR